MDFVLVEKYKIVVASSICNLYVDKLSVPIITCHTKK